MATIILVPKKQRRRPAVSCTLCRQRKIRCNRASPCTNCLRSRSGTCTYEPSNSSSTLHQGAGPHPGSRSQPESRNHSADTSSPSAATASGGARGDSDPPRGSRPDQGIPTPSSEQFAQHTETVRLKLRIRQLESQLETARATATVTQTHSPGSLESGHVSGAETTRTRLGGTFHLHYRQDVSSTSEPIVQSVSVKARMFGQSHWIVGSVSLICEVFTILEPHLHSQPSKAWTGIEKCKALARYIKCRRTPMHPFATIKLPSRTVADALVTNYLRETESIYRILHIPTFTKKYEEIWNPDIGTASGANPDPAFLIQLKLVLAIGAVTYDDKFPLRTSAIHWIHEAQTWMAGPKYKARLNIHSIQINLLLLLAQERVGVIAELPWVSAGTLLRTAMYMGLHRDPTHTAPGTKFEVEMHRRLWNTILELNLQTSLTSGGAPMISLADFDTAPPSNLDDEQLEVQDSVTKPDGEYTQPTIAIELRRAFPQRLAVVKFLNDRPSTGTYEETLRLDAELRTAYRALNQSICACPTSHTRPSIKSFDYETKALDFLMNRYISALHVPYFSAALQGDGNGSSYAFSRKTVIDCALKVWRTAIPTNSPDERNPLSRLATCSAGFYPSVAIHAAFLIAVELRSQLEEDDSLRPIPLRPDLFCVLEEAKPWSLRVIEAGETNVKGCLLINLVTAHVEGLMGGVGKGEMETLLIRAVEDVGEMCVPLLEELVAAQNREIEAGEMQPEAVPVTDILGDVAADWNFATPDSTFDFDADPMSWIINDDIGSEMPML